MLAANITDGNKSGDNPYPVYSSQTKDNGLMGYYKDYLYENAITWTTDGANAGTVNYRDEKFYCTNVCGVLLGDKVTPNQMLAEAINNVAKSYVSYVGNPKLMNNVMAEICIWLPSEDTERKAISSFVYSLDYLITLHQSKSFGHILKAIVSCTLSWEQRKLGEIGSVAMCRRVFKYQTTESGDIPFFKIGSFGATPDAFIPKDLFEKLKMKYPYPEKGDVLISASGSIGRTVVFTGKDEYFQDSNIVWLKHDNSIINHFLKYLYSIVKWVGIEGTTIKRLYNDNILKTEVIIPTLSEQQKVSNYLDGLDHLITLHQLEPFQLIFKAIAYRIIDYTKSKPPSHRK